MDTKSRWSDNRDSSLFVSKDETISEVQKNFDIRRYNSAEGYSVEVDGVVEQVLIQPHVSLLNENKQDVRFHCTLTCNIHTGSYIKWDDNTWIVISKIDIVGNAYKSLQIYKADKTITFHKNSISYTVPYMIGSISTSISETKYDIELNGGTVFRVARNDITDLLEVNDIMKIGRKNYKIIDIDELSQDGLLIIKYEQVLQEPEPIEPIPLPITNGAEIIGSDSIVKNYTEEYSCVFKVNGVTTSYDSVFYLTDETGNSD